MDRLIKNDLEGNPDMIGTDPEFFATNRFGPVPAHRLFGDKNNKTLVGYGGGKAFRDGYAIEINVPPASSPSVLVGRVQEALRGVIKKLPRGTKLQTPATVEIDLAKDLKDAPEDVLHFGCEPSYCAYTGERKMPSINAWEHPERYAGAHMHFSATPEELERGIHKWLFSRSDHELFIKMCDLHIGVPLTAIYGDKKQFQRRKWYGQAGEYRPQEYPDGSIGIEYRTPPPQLYNHAEIAIRVFWIGLHLFNGFEQIKPYWKSVDEARTRHAINTGEGVRELLTETGVAMVQQYAKAPIYKMFQLPYQLTVAERR